MKSIKSSRTTFYGKVDIKKYPLSIYEWKIKILQRGNLEIFIGIDTSYKNNNNGFYWYGGGLVGSNYYTFGNSARIVRPTGPRDSYGVKWAAGDIIKMEINTKDSSLKYFVNDKDCGFVPRGIDLSNSKIYHLAISMYNTGDSVEIESFAQQIIQ